MLYDGVMSEIPVSSPASVRVVFSQVDPIGVHPEEQRASYCASGHVFLGEMLLLDAEAHPLMALPVQSGGWMSKDSPFAREGLCPADPTPGHYEPRLYPDTAFPQLPAPTTLGTLRTGMHRGFRVPDPPGTGRSFLMIHASTRYGSEGCISTPDLELWEQFCDHLAALYAAGFVSIPLCVVYECPPPHPHRCPA